jgi:hypothetical protein
MIGYDVPPFAQLIQQEYIVRQCWNLVCLTTANMALMCNIWCNETNYPRTTREISVLCICTVVLSFVRCTETNYTRTLREISGFFYICTVYCHLFVRPKFYFHVFHAVLETSNTTEENVRMTARNSVNNLLGKIHNKSVIVLLINDGTIDKQRLSGILSLRTVLLACLFAFLLAILVTMSRVPLAINKVRIISMWWISTTPHERRILCVFKV